VVLRDLEQVLKARTPNARNFIASKHNVPVGNISGWVKNKKKIYKSAGKTQAAKLLPLQSREVAAPSGSHKCRKRLRMQYECEAELSRLRQFIMDKVKIRQLDRKAVSLTYVVRETPKRIASLASLGITLKYRGKQFEASRTWCWRLLILSGEVNRTRGCKRSTPPPVMAASIRHFAHFVRECVIPASLEK